MKSAIINVASAALVVFGSVSIVIALYRLVYEPEVWHRIWFHLIDRPSGPISFRFILQPVMAVLAAWKDGKKDALGGRRPYFWTVVTDEKRRVGRLLEGLHATGKIIALGVAMDLAYQAIVLGNFFPVEAFLVVVMLAFVPYLVMRGTFARLIKWRTSV